MEDGEAFDGFSFGLNPSSPTVGEIVFNTGMVGYTETMTDPSYSGQILCFTYPLIGNYGVPNYIKDDLGIVKNFESEKIQVKGLIASQVSKEPNHFESSKSIARWMSDEGVCGIEGLDTRELTLHLRERGVMMGAIARSVEEGTQALARSLNYSKINFYEIVSTRNKRTFGKNVNGKVAVIDCGVKLNIVRSLVRRGFEVDVLPYTATFEELTSSGRYNGIVFSNGPGDPKTCPPAIELARTVIQNGMPTLGICLGTQIIALSQGAETFKLKYGHRGQNKPCVDLRTGKSMVTSQNHGYSVKEESLQGTKLVPWFVNADDHTLEGLIHQTSPCISVQFHPEASPGPVDAGYVFDVFSDKIAKAS